MGIVGEVTERHALAVPRPSKAPPVPLMAGRSSPVFLMKLRIPEFGVSRQRWHIDKLHDS
jgi:hypothetical protein